MRRRDLRHRQKQFRDQVAYPPEPEEAYEYLPGFARRSEMNSFTLAAGNEGCVTSIYGLLVNWMIGEKIPHRIVAHLLHVGTDRERADRARKQRVAVGRGL
jgi:hypothetical protein